MTHSTEIVDGIYYFHGIGFQIIDNLPKERFILHSIAFESTTWKITIIYLVTILLVLGFLSILLSPLSTPTPKLSSKSSSASLSASTEVKDQKPLSRSNSKNSLYQSPVRTSRENKSRTSPGGEGNRSMDPLWIVGSPR